MVCLERIILTLVLDYDETILIVFFLHEHTASTFLGKVRNMVL